MSRVALLHLLFSISAVLTIPSFLAYHTVWGKAKNGTYSVLKNTTSYQECLQLCMDRPECVLAWGNTTCKLYDFGKIYTVLQFNRSTAGPQGIVSFRVNQDHNQCPLKTAVDPPTFDDFPAYGRILADNNISYYYYIGLDSGIWSYKSSTQNFSSLVCADSWKVLERKYRAYCVRLVESKILTPCSNYYDSAMKSGIESVDEMEFLRPNLTKFGKINLNATMTDTCRNSNGTNCESIWSESCLTLPAHIPWLPGYPTSKGDCIALSQVNGTDTIGLMNIPCSQNTTGGTYCVYYMYNLK